MLIATNRGTGINIGFIQICLVPAAPAPLPMPFPDIGLHVMIIGFSLNVYWTNMNAVSLIAKIPMTLGHFPGVAHPLYMKIGGFTIGSFIVFVNFLPAIHLCAITFGNGYNCPVGGNLVPSVTVVFITLRGIEQGDTEQRAPGQLTEAEVRRIRDVMRDEAELPSIEARRIDETTACLRVRAFSTHTSTRAYNALRKLGAFERLIIDLRDNPGGDADAALAFAGDFVEPGTLLAIRRDEGRYDKEMRSRLHGPYTWDVAIVVDRGTASAAEVFAGAMQLTGRAELVGERTYGKGTAQRFVPGEGGAVYTTVAEFLLPDGTPIDGVGLTPDLTAPAAHDAALVVADALLAREPV